MQASHTKDRLQDSFLSGVTWITVANGRRSFQTGHRLPILHLSQYDSRMSSAALVVFSVQGCICIGLNPSGEGGREVSPSG